MASKTTQTYTHKKEGLKGRLLTLIALKLRVLEFLSPIGPLILRFWVAIIFWKSGLIKIEDWDTAILLFTDIHPVPYLSPELAAYLGTMNELVLPCLLFLGLGSRIAAFGLLFMTFTIQYTFESNVEHAIWAIMLLPILLQGPGRFSWDFFIRYHYFEKMPEHISALSQNLALIVTVFLTIFTTHEVLTMLIDSWDTPWIAAMRDWWNSIDASLGSAFRD